MKIKRQAQYNELNFLKCQKQFIKKLFQLSVKETKII